MENKELQKIESILKYYSIESNKTNELFIDYLLNDSPKEDIIKIDKEKENRFLNRFSDEMSFAELVKKCLKKYNINNSKVKAAANISGEVLNAIITEKILPNKIPIKRMLNLLALLQIPITKAVACFRTSLKRYDCLNSASSPGFVSFKKNSGMISHSVSFHQSKESLKRNLEVYIKRLTEEEGK